MTGASLYVVGAPGTGKSSFLEALVHRLGWSWEPDVKVWRELWVNPLTHRGDTVGAALGRRRDAFSGTDALSLSVCPRAIEWVRQAELPPFVVGEGQRLSATTFLAELDRRRPLTVVHLGASDEALEARRELRGDTFKPGFLKGAKTRARTAVDTMAALGVPCHYLNTDELDAYELAENFLKEFRDFALLS